MTKKNDVARIETGVRNLDELLYLSGEHVRSRQFLSGLDDTIRTQRTRRFSVVKTRGSSHDRGTHYFSIIRGGIRIGERVNAGGTPGGKGRSAHRRAKRRERQ